MGWVKLEFLTQLKLKFNPTFFTRVHYKQRDFHSNPLFLKSSIIKFPDKVKIENCLFISKYIHNKLPSTFNNWFTFSSNSHKYETTFATQGNLKVPSVRTTSYGKSSFTSMAIKTWNELQKEIKGKTFNEFSPNKLKSILQDYFLNLYKIS